MQFKSTFIIAFAAMALLARPIPGHAVGGEADTLADLLIAASDGAELDRNPLDYDIIVQTVIALEALGGDPDLGGATLLDVLSNRDAEITVFVPHDGAFRKLARDLGWDGRGGDAGAFAVITGAFDLATIRDVVKYHVVGAHLNIFDVLRQRTFDTVLPGASFRRVRLFSLQDNEPDLKNPRLRPPVQLQRGRSVAHTISRVLIPVDL
jgi:hypothetical protein